MARKKTQGDADTSTTELNAKTTADEGNNSDSDQGAGEGIIDAEVIGEPASGDQTGADSDAENEPLNIAGDVTEASLTLDDTNANEGAGNETPEPDHIATVPVTTPSRPEPRRRVAIGIVMAGVIAAAAGYLAARADLIDPLLPASWRSPDAAAALAPQIETLQAEIQSLRGDLSAIDIPQAAPPAQDFSAPIAKLNGAISDLTSRVAALESRPASPANGVNSGVLDDLQSQLSDQRAEIGRLAAAAAEAEQVANAKAQATLARAAMTRILAAIDSGAPYATALSDLKNAAATDVPPELDAVAEDGVAAVATLQATLPEASRAALAAARAGDTGETGVAAFLQRQLAVRSVTPRDGADPDAVLSRVEAAIGDGRLTDALAEAETLPAPAQEAMSGWLDRARQRRDVVNAADALMQRLSSN